LIEKVKIASGYALKVMKSTRVRVLPPIEPPPAPKPAQVKPIAAVDLAPAATPPEPVQPPAKPRVFDYVYRATYQNETGEEKMIQEITLNSDQVAESFLDGVGPAGSRGRELALGLAIERTPPDFTFVPDSLKFDLARLIRSMEET
jgi:hypothetical protein